AAELLGAQQPAHGVTVRGFVRADDGRGIPLAEVSDRASGLKVSADSSGAFVLPDIPLGERIIDVRRIGFGAQQFPITLVAGKNRNVALVLPPVAQALPDVKVNDKLGKPARYANTRRYDVFYARRAQGFGTFLTREDIDRQFKTNTPELLQGIPGMKVKRIGNEWKIQSLECQLGMPGEDPGKWIRIFINGMDVGDASELASVNPAEIEAMEIYKSPGTLPVEARGKGCAAIFIWTRDGS
ncbi:MAG: carboxypeptidase regulatory-like domain-containing protein, partial [Thermoanaerobaculia bacterium]